MFYIITFHKDVKCPSNPEDGHGLQLIDITRIIKTKCWTTYPVMANYRTFAAV